jgi:hypothetical protein
MSVDRQVTDDQPHTQVAVDERSVEVRAEHGDEQTLLAVDGDGIELVAAVDETDLSLAEEVMLARAVEAAVESVTDDPASGGGSNGA